MRLLPLALLGCLALAGCGDAPVRDPGPQVPVGLEPAAATSGPRVVRGEGGDLVRVANGAYGFSCLVPADWGRVGGDSSTSQGVVSQRELKGGPSATCLGTTGKPSLEASVQSGLRGLRVTGQAYVDAAVEGTTWTLRSRTSDGTLVVKTTFWGRDRENILSWSFAEAEQAQLAPLVERSQRGFRPGPRDTSAPGPFPSLPPGR